MERGSKIRAAQAVTIRLQRKEAEVRNSLKNCLPGVSHKTDRIQKQGQGLKCSSETAQMDESERWEYQLVVWAQGGRIWPCITHGVCDVGKDLHQDQLECESRPKRWPGLTTLGTVCSSWDAKLWVMWDTNLLPSPSVLHFAGWDLVSFAASGF